MTSIASVHQTPPSLPSRRVTVTRQELADPIGELRSMAAGQSRLLPTLAHVEAAVAHIDQLRSNLDESDRTLHDVLGDWLRERIARQSLERELATLKEL